MSDDFKLSFDTIRELRIHNAVMVLTDRDDGGVEIDVYPVPADAREGMEREGEDAVLARATSPAGQMLFPASTIWQCQLLQGRLFQEV